MSDTILIKEATVVNEGKSVPADVLIRNGRIESIGNGLSASGAREITVRSDFRARGPEEVAGYPIASMDGKAVYLRDVAEVLNTAREQRSLYRFNGKPAVEISVVQQPEASSVRVIAGVKA